MYGERATPANEFGYDWLPKLDVGYDALKMFDVMYQGQTTGLICQGFNPLMAIADKGKTVAALSKLKFLVSLDPIETDTVRFWENHGEFNDVDTAAIQTEVFMLPVTSFVEEDGTLTNSSRVVQWKWKAADPYFESRSDIHDPRRPVPATPHALRGAGRDRAGAAAGGRLELRRPGGADARRAPEGAQRQGARGRQGRRRAR